MKQIIITMALLAITTAANAEQTETVTAQVIAHGVEYVIVRNVQELDGGKLYFEEIINGIDGYTVRERTITAPWQIIKTREIRHNPTPAAKNWRKVK